MKDWNRILTTARLCENFSADLARMRAVPDGDTESTLSVDDAILKCASMLLSICAFMLSEWYQNSPHTPRTYTEEELLRA